MPNREIFNFAPETAPVSQSGGNPIEHTGPEEIKKDLFNFNEKVEKRTENQNEDFLKQLSEMDKRGATPENIIGIRRGAALNDPDSLERHIRLSAAFTKAENNPAAPGQKTISINFKGNNLAENYVGLGDILPPHAERVTVYGLEGQIITGGAVRKINPQTGRVGYFDEATGAYIAVHSGFRINVIASRTDTPAKAPNADPVLQRRKMAEAVTIFQDQKTFNREFFKPDDDQKGIPPPKPNTTAEQFNFASIPNEPNPAATKSSVPESEQPQKSFNEYNPVPLRKIPSGIPGKAKEILHRGNPIGTVTVFEQDGKTYIARDEVHCHAATDNVPDALKQNHHGVTVYEARNA